MDHASHQHLRRLAGDYAAAAVTGTMDQRRQKWLHHNGLRERTCPFHIEDNGTFLRDLTPPLQCADPVARQLEARLQLALVSHRMINDDRIIPDRFVVDWVTKVGNYCDELQFRHVDDGHGGTFGYESNHPIRNLDADLGKIKRRILTVDRTLTEQHAMLAEEVFRGLLPVAVGRCSSFYSNGIANKAVHLMGMQELYLQMAESPASVHRLLTLLAEDNLALGQQEEDLGLLTLNHDGNQGYCSGTSLYSDEIPGRQLVPGEPVHTADCYGYLEAQEAAGISPDMFAEFLMPHFRRFAAKFKLLKFGCCEPVHHLMVHLHTLPGIRKVSVTPWCDQEQMAANCRRDIIWVRKPVPLKLCGDLFDPDDLRAHLRETLALGADHFVEFVFRDTNRLTGAMADRVAAACRIVRDVTGHPEGALA